MGSWVVFLAVLTINHYILDFIINRLLLLPTPLRLRMASSLSSFLLPMLLTVGCVALVMNIMSAKKMNKSLVQNVERVQADLKVAMDTSQECSKQLEMKSGDLTAKDQQLASLTNNVNVLTDEKNKMVEQVTQLQAELDQANADKDALAAEKNNLANDLEELKASNVAKEEKAPEVDAPNPEVPKKEAAKVESPKEEAKPQEEQKGGAPKEDSPAEGA